jgi:H+/Cl- antiporter ClcA
MSGEKELTLKAGYYRLMVYAALFGALFSMLTAGYITLYNQGIKFFDQPSLYLFNVNIWPLILLSIASIFIGLAIKFFGQHGGLGVAQRQYAQTGRLDYRSLPSIILQAFIALWSGAAVGPEGPLVFLTGGVGSFISDRLRLQKDEVQVLVYSAIAGAFGGFFGSPVVGAVGAFEYMYIRELDLYRHLIPGLIAAAVGYSVYFALLHTSYLGIYSFPNYASPHLIDLGYALLVGVIAGVIGIMFKIIFGLMHLVFGRVDNNKRPIIRAMICGVLIGLIGFVSPVDTLLWTESVAGNYS